MVTDTLDGWANPTTRLPGGDAPVINVLSFMMQCIPCASAQSCISYNITGWVIDCTTGVYSLPVTGATVYVLGHPEFGTTTTDANGCFDLGAAPGGTYGVVAVSGPKSGMSSISLPDVTPPCGDCLQISICLTTGGPCPDAVSPEQCCTQLRATNNTQYQNLCTTTITPTITLTTTQTATANPTATTATITATSTTTSQPLQDNNGLFMLGLGILLLIAILLGLYLYLKR